MSDLTRDSSNKGYQDKAVFLNRTFMCFLFNCSQMNILLSNLPLQKLAAMILYIELLRIIDWHTETEGALYPKT